jgi:hemerythrin-like domain-containing protein
MSTSTQPSIARDLVRIHSVITRALDVAIEHSQSFLAQGGYPNTSVWQGFVHYVQCLFTVLESHHTVEDELMFPYFQNKLLDTPFDLLEDQHREMLPLLAEVDVALKQVAATMKANESLSMLNHALTKLRELWYPHFRLEEAHFTDENVAAAASMGEQGRLTEMFAERAKKDMSPDYLVVPFVLYNLSPDDRAVMSQFLPPVVIERLVPIDWKEKWATMLPFLLA